MKHKLKINVANDSPKEGIIACKKKKVRRGLLRKLFGANANKKEKDKQYCCLLITKRPKVVEY